MAGFTWGKYSLAGINALGVEWLTVAGGGREPRRSSVRVVHWRHGTRLDWLQNVVRHLRMGGSGIGLLVEGTQFVERVERILQELHRARRVCGRARGRWRRFTCGCRRVRWVGDAGRQLLILAVGGTLSPKGDFRNRLLRK